MDYYSDSDDVAVLWASRNGQTNHVHGIEDHGVSWIDEINNIANCRASREVIGRGCRDDFNEEPIDSLIHNRFLNVMDTSHN